MATTTEVDTDTSESTAWHAIAADEVVRQLHSNTQSGLDVDEVSRRLERYGRNILIYVLLAAGFVKLMVGLWLDAAIIFGVVLLNALLGFIQEGKAEKTLDSIRHMLSAEARTLRGEEVRMVPAEGLVPGDIVLLESGDKIPADLRLVDVKNLRTEEAALTGESVPIDKATGAVSEKATIGDREGMAFSETLVAAGRATGVVVATGSHTELGRINQMMAAVPAVDADTLTVDQGEIADNPNPASKSRRIR